MARDALGIIETQGFAPLVIAADAAVKSANVELVEWRKVGSGYVSFVIEGDVAAVKSAIEAGVEAASKIGEVLSQLIRCYGDTLQGSITNFFERSLILFEKQQQEISKNMFNPMSFMTEIAEQNLNLWKDLQESFFSATVPKKSTKNNEK